MPHIANEEMSGYFTSRLLKFGKKNKALRNMVLFSKQSRC